MYEKLDAVCSIQGLVERGAVWEATTTLILGVSGITLSDVVSVVFTVLPKIIIHFCYKKQLTLNSVQVFHTPGKPNVIQLHAWWILCLQNCTSALIRRLLNCAMNKHISLFAIKLSRLYRGRNWFNKIDDYVDLWEDLQRVRNKIRSICHILLIFWVVTPFLLPILLQHWSWDL